MKKSIFSLSFLLAGLAFAGSVEITNDYIIGVMPVKANGRGQIMLSIPWVEAGGGYDTIAVSNLVKTASLSAETVSWEGDSLTWYNTETEAFEGWRLEQSGGTNYWAGIPIAGSEEPPTGADVPVLVRGQGLILERVSSNEVVYVVGQVGTNATVTTNIPASEDGKTPKYTLIAPPFASGTATNANFLVFSTTPHTKDRIRLEAIGGANTNTELKRKYDDADKKYVWVNASNGSKAQAMLPAGRGFIYIRYGTGDLSVTWDAPSTGN